MIKPLKVSEGVFRGPQPRTPEDWAILRAIGVAFALDLETGSEFFLDSSPLEEILIGQRHGIKVFSHPLGEILPPTRRELTHARAIIDQFRPIYVHCKAGVDRTGMVIGSFEIQSGFSRREAIARMKRAGMHVWYYWWTWFL